MLRWILPVAVALAAHGVGIGGDFVGDDIPDIVEHPVVGGGAPLTELFDYNVMGDPRGEGANTIRPLATLMFALEWRLAGPRPAVFHALSVLWFVALVVIAQRTMGRLLSPRAAAAGAALFAALAIHVDAVALIANRPEVCSLLFALLALGAAVDGRTAAACALYLVALLFKESAFLLPAIAAWWIAAADRPSALHPRRRGKPVLALALLAAAFFAGRSLLLSFDVSGAILPADNPLLIAEAPARLWMPWVLLGEYLELTAIPVDLAFDHTYAAIPVDADLSRGTGWLGVGFGAALVAIAALRFSRGPRAAGPLRALAVAAGGFAASYALFSNSLVLIVTLFAERLFLAPSLFLALGLAAAGAALAPRIGSRPIRIAAGAGIALIVCTQIALAAARTWECRSERSLLAAQVAARPDSVKGQLYRARVLARGGEHLEAIWHLGVAAAGRAAFPGPFEAPRREGVPIRARLAELPELLAPEESPRAFWAGFRSFVARTLGPASAAALDRELAAPDL